MWSCEWFLGLFHLGGAAPPPLPPKPSSTAKPKLPVESKGVRQEVTFPEKGSALSCPNCFCLNSGDAKNCLFCKKPLPVKSHDQPATQQSNNTEARNFPPPLWALSPEQRVTAQQMQSSQRNTNVVTSSGAGLCLTLTALLVWYHLILFHHCQYCLCVWKISPRVAIQVKVKRYSFLSLGMHEQILFLYNSVKFR